jgi:hypothetical protein
MNFNNKAITITFGDQAENHLGMQKIGQMATCGLSIDELKSAKTKFEKLGCLCQIINLNQALPEEIDAESACVLIIRKGVDKLLSKINSNADLMFHEQNQLNTDKKALMYGRVVNKHARHNLCFSDFSQEPDYEHGLGRIISFNNVPLTKKIRDELPKYFTEKTSNLPAEGNYYYDATKTGIGYHGDSERKIVIAVRLGQSIPLVYNWFYKSEPIGQKINLVLNHGDMYVMSEKAVGTDWKNKNKYTLRHAAGCEKYTTL